MLPGDSDTPLLVSYSGGKDSLVVMDQCVSAGRKVEAFMLTFLPDMDCFRFWADYAWARWRVRPRMHQDPAAIRLMRRGVFRHAPLKVPAVTVRDIETCVRDETGIEWIGYGYKRVDCIDRACMLKTWPNGIHEGWKKFAPIADWKHGDVFSYLRRKRIEIPNAVRFQMSGVGVGAEALRTLRENWPADYRRVMEVFPLAEAQADRVELLNDRRREQRATARSGAGVRVPGDFAVADQPGAVQPA